MSEIDEIKKAILQASKNYDRKVLRKKRQNKLYRAYYSDYMSSIEYQVPTSEIYMRGKDYKWLQAYKKIISMSAW